jgi:hypothetical protein
MECGVCKRFCKNMRSLSIHVKRAHKMEPKIYKIKYGLLIPVYCEICNKEIDANKTNRCNKCRDRNGVNNPFFGKLHTAEYKEKRSKENSIKGKAKWKDPEYRAKVIKGTSKPRHPDFGKRHSETMKQMYINNPEQRALRSVAMKRSWANGAIVKNGYSCNSSSLEEQLYEEIKNIVAPTALRKQTIHIGNKWYFPDILIDNKYIIEFYGDYWHANPEVYKENTYINNYTTAKEIWENDKHRLQKLIDAKYIIYVVWENEYLKSKEKIIDILDRRFNWEETPDDPCVIYI